MIDKNKSILITGATGFIGSNLLRKLIIEGFTNISIISRKESNYFRINDILEKIKIYNVSILDEVELNKCINIIKPKIIFHLATAGTTLGKDPITIKELYDFNILGTINLLNICKKVGFDYFINTGSSSEYGQKDKAMKENDILEPNNDYGITKVSSTLYCSYIGKKEQLPIYTFRVFSAYGPFEEKRRLVPTIIINYLNGISPSLSSPNSVRDYIFIDDIVNCYLNIDKIQSDFGGIINLGYGKQYKISEIVAIIKNILKSNIDPKYGVEQKKQIEPKMRVSDNAKMINTLGVKLHTLEEGLVKSIQWFQKNLHIYK